MKDLLVTVELPWVDQLDTFSWSYHDSANFNNELSFINQSIIEKPIDINSYEHEVTLRLRNYEEDLEPFIKVYHLDNEISKVVNKISGGSGGLFSIEDIFLSIINLNQLNL